MKSRFPLAEARVAALAATSARKEDLVISFLAFFGDELSDSVVHQRLGFKPPRECLPGPQTKGSRKISENRNILGGWAICSFNASQDATLWDP